MECGPPDNDDICSAADPLLAVAVPSDVAPSRNWTVPVAVAGDTVAVKVTGWPNADGFGVALSVTLEEDLETVCVTAADVLVV
jgi:hypothetical protein